jgi:hypothetical protein
MKHVVVNYVDNLCCYLMFRVFLVIEIPITNVNVNFVLLMFGKILE